MPFADLDLARRLERAEGHACQQFARARQRFDPASGAAYMECAGAWVVFDGVDSPVTQTFGLGVFEDLTPDALDTIERFFLDRNAPVCHEVSPLAGVAALDLLCRRQYVPIEISNVLYQPLEAPAQASEGGPIRVRLAGPDEGQLWSELSAAGWAHDHPEFLPFLLSLGRIGYAREDHYSFLAEYEGEPGAAGALFIHEGVALLTGAATIPTLRRRGLQAALLKERLRFAHARGCDLAMMVAEAGSTSQRNAERRGFLVAYTRLKWKLAAGG